jgi:NAD(P)-dependent dehydrogenase (short-subunit alcohol dehydrogenase family)
MPCGDIALSGKVVLVTGGGSGINLAFSKLVHQQGAKVIIADLQLTAEGSAFINEVPSSSAIFVQCDVRKRADLENLITVSKQRFGDVPDIYIAGAGVFEPVGISWRTQ